MRRRYGDLNPHPEGSRQPQLSRKEASKHCRHHAPCGASCILDPYYAHTYHTCKDNACPECHGRRFSAGRVKSS